MIRPATTKDMHHIRSLWRQSYRDSNVYVDFFYENVISPEYTMLYIQDDIPVGMLTVLPARMTLCNNTEPETVCVLYGGAVLPKYRHRGYMTELVRYCEHNAVGVGCTMCVVSPGPPHLFEFFRNLGYHDDFSVRYVKMKPGMLDNERNNNYIYSNLSDWSLMYEIREGALRNIPHLIWNANQMGALVKEARFYGESVLMASNANSIAYAVCGMNGRSLAVKEILGTDNEACEALLKHIIDTEHPSSATVRLPVGSDVLSGEGLVYSFGMVRQLKVAPTMKDLSPYMNLMLD